MPHFYIDLDGAGLPEVAVEATSVDLARDEAIVLLGSYLQDRPAFAYQRHWRVDIKDAARRHLMYVIVACVEAAPQLNLASYEVHTNADSLDRH